MQRPDLSEPASPPVGQEQASGYGQAPSDRRRAVEAFLARHGWHPRQAVPLAADASFRSYHRLRDGRRRAVLMDAPPPREDVRPFTLVARHLRGLGLSAPTVLGEDVENGLLLLEDLGDDTFTRLLDSGADGEPLYRLATEVLVDIHRRPAAQAIPLGLPQYDEALFLDECLLLSDWYIPAVLGAPLSAPARDAYVAAWRQVLPMVYDQPVTLVLRDFHVDNLIRLPGRSGVAACGLLDFQDAVSGPIGYDLVSLLEDARRDVPDAIRNAMVAHYRYALPTLCPPKFADACHVLAAQRHAKVIGIFTRLCRRDGKPQYLHHIPRVWRMLDRALRQGSLAPVRAWLDRHLPPPARTVPTAQSTYGSSR